MTTVIRSLEVRLNDVLVGYLTHFPDEKTLFVVDESYLNYGSGRPILSLSLARPRDEDITQALLRDERHKSSFVKAPPFFSNLLPEGGLRRRIAAELKIHEDREFDMLAALGRDLPGAVVLSPAETLDHIKNHRGTALAVASSVPPELKFSLGGMQMKFSMLRKNDRFTLPRVMEELGDYIVKPPSNDYVGLPMIEAASMTLARAVGIEVPNVMLVEPERIDDLKHLTGYREGEPFYAVQRFDRTGNGGRCHIEDFAQVFNLRTHKKYGQANYEQIGRTLLQYAGGVEDVREFARRLTFNVLMGNGDAHVKNWSLIYEDPRQPRLAPAYDLVPTVAYVTTDRTMALNMGGIRNFKEISLETFDNFLLRIGLLDQVRKDVIDTVVDTGRNILGAWEGHFVEMGVPSELADQVRVHQQGLRLASDIQR